MNKHTKNWPYVLIAIILFLAGLYSGKLYLYYGWQSGFPDNKPYIDILETRSWIFASLCFVFIATSVAIIVRTIKKVNREDKRTNSGMNEIVLTGWNPAGLNKVGLTLLLRDKAGMELHEAKNCTDSVVDGIPVTIKIESYELAKHIFTEAVKLGAVGQHLLTRDDGWGGVRITYPSYNAELLKLLLGKKIVSVKRQLFTDDKFEDDYEQDADGPIELTFDDKIVIHFIAETEITSVGIVSGSMPKYRDSYEMADVTGNSFWQERVGQEIKQISYLKAISGSESYPYEFGVELLFRNGKKVLFEYLDDEEHLDMIRVADQYRGEDPYITQLI